MIIYNERCLATHHCYPKNEVVNDPTKPLLVLIIYVLLFSTSKLNTGHGPCHSRIVQLRFLDSQVSWLDDSIDISCQCIWAWPCIPFQPYLIKGPMMSLLLYRRNKSHLDHTNPSTWYVTYLIITHIIT